MSTRSLLVAATALAAGFSATNAEALAPYSMDETLASTEPQTPLAEARLAPRDFARTPDAAFEPNPSRPDRHVRLQCVPFARREAGIEIYGNANTWWAQAKDRYQRDRAPHEGAVAVFRGYAGAERGHVAVVRQIVSERMIIVDHANWLNGGEITRDVPVRDVSARGDWSQVQVWNVVQAHWGARTYNVQGFILNAPAKRQEASNANAATS
ncbi:MAG TPA: CHAP domain-containing protein [Caulobacterales bacterium]|nr:CHAP domain-containing protein [Caulobacterales bacterium]